MPSMNEHTIMGHLGKDPESRFMPDGKAVCSFSIATSESWKDKNTGQKKERTDWHNITMFGRLAEVAGQYLRKGSLVLVRGPSRTRKWQDNEGKDRYTVEVHADTLKMLSRSDSAPVQSGSAQEQAPDFDDDIPF